MARKRSNSGLDDYASQPKKIQRNETYSLATDALTSANARVVELERQIKELHAFINATGLTRVAPHSIRQHMFTGPGAAKALADQIMIAAGKVVDELERETMTGVTSDDMSRAMMPFLDEIEGLRKLPESTVVAFDLVMILGGYTYGDLDSDGGGYGRRPSDSEVDDLLVQLAEERIKIEPFWNFSQVLGILQEQAEYMSEYGIRGFCAQTIDLLSAWQNELPTSEERDQGH